MVNEYDLPGQYDLSMDKYVGQEYQFNPEAIGGLLGQLQKEEVNMESK